MVAGEPIYRAKKIDSDENVEGIYIEVPLKHSEDYPVIQTKEREYSDLGHLSFEHFEIDPSTLAIHFPDMIDSEGTKIFASLSEDGKGGDMLMDDMGNEFVALFSKNGISIKETCIDARFVGRRTGNLKVTGIQE